MVKDALQYICCNGAGTHSLMIYAGSCEQDAFNLTVSKADLLGQNKDELNLNMAVNSLPPAVAVAPADAIQPKEPKRRSRKKSNGMRHAPAMMSCQMRLSLERLPGEHKASF